MRANGEFVKDDKQDINFSTDKLVSIVNTKPISGYTQSFTYETAQQMAENNGEGWQLTDLRFESLHQMLMSIEYECKSHKEHKCWQSSILFKF